MRSSNSSISDKEAKERVRRNRSDGEPPMPGPLPSEAASRGVSPMREVGDREAKQAARRLSSDEAPKPGAQSSMSSEDRSARKQQRNSGTEQDRPGTSASAASDDRTTRKEHRNAKTAGGIGVGVGVAAGVAAGAKTSASNNNNITPPVTSEPLDPSTYEVQAVAVNDDAEDERVRKLEAQMQAMMMMNQAAALPSAQVHTAHHQPNSNNAESDDSGDDDDDDVPCCQKHKGLLLVIALLAIGGGVAGYLLGQAGSEEPVVSNSPAPIANMTPSPNPKTTIAPTSAPTPFLIFQPPSDAECFAIANGVPLNDQEFMNTTSVGISFDVSLKAEQDDDSWLTRFEEGLQSNFVPALAGCPMTQRRRRRLLEEVRNNRKEDPSRYAIANADSFLAFRPEESCATGAAQPCKRVQVFMDLYVKDEFVTFFDVVNIYYDVVGSDDAAANLGVFGLSTDQFQGVSIAGIENLSPTEAPTTVVPIPTPPPTIRGTPSPTAKTPGSSGNRRGLLQSILSQHAPLNNRALEWLANTDQWEPDADAFNAEDQWRERYAMAVFYYETGGDRSWTDRTNWLSSTSICAGGWFGINACQNNQVLDLTIVANNLVGSLPTEIGLLTSLTKLAPFENVNLSGTIPTEIGLLTALAAIELDITGLKGNIPSEIGKLTRLSEFFAFDSFIAGTIPSEIGETNLATFEVYNTGLRGNIPEELWSLTLLQSLKIFETSLDGTISTRIGQLRVLEVLEIDGCFLTGTIPSEIGELTFLTFLTAFGNEFTGNIPSEIGRLTRLSTMELDTNFLTGTIPAEILQLGRLEVFHLYNNTLVGNVPPLPAIAGECNLSGNCFSGFSNAIARNCVVDDNCLITA